MFAKNLCIVNLSFFFFLSFYRLVQVQYIRSFSFFSFFLSLACLRCVHGKWYWISSFKDSLLLHCGGKCELRCRYAIESVEWSGSVIISGDWE